MNQDKVGKDFENLKNGLLKKLEARGYSTVTVTDYRYLCNASLLSLNQRGIINYSRNI